MIPELGYFVVTLLPVKHWVIPTSTQTVVRLPQCFLGSGSWKSIASYWSMDRPGLYVTVWCHWTQLFSTEGMDGLKELSDIRGPIPTRACSDWQHLRVSSLPASVVSEPWERRCWLTVSPCSQGHSQSPALIPSNQNQPRPSAPSSASRPASDSSRTFF